MSLKIQENKALTDEEMIIKINEGNEEYRNVIIKKNMGFIHSVVNEFKGVWEKEDLVQSGMIGMNDAINTYDPEKSNGATFLTYAYYSVKRQITKELRRHSRNVRIPYNITVLQRKLTEKKMELTEKGIKYDEEFLAKELGETLKAVKLAERVRVFENANLYSLNTLASKGSSDETGTTSLGDLLKNDEPEIEETMVETEYESNLKKDVKRVLNTFSPEHKKVLELRYGLNGNEVVNTLEEIAEILGVSKERVRQIELLVLKHLRDSCSGRRSLLKKYI